MSATNAPRHDAKNAFQKFILIQIEATKLDNKVETVYLLLGSNLGDSQNYLKLARMEIGRIGQIQSTSSIYQTKPWGKTDQPDFLNQAIGLQTNLSPQALLARIHEIEFKLGRHRIEKWGPRIIDIDIIFYGNQVIEAANLIIPHPKMRERRFVLAPLAEISPALVHPILKESVAELLELCKDSLEVTKYNPALD
jgi:2-amino-4-hydroxy-6-hydroxymethyldihydropteridine diphosphokinase